MRWWEEGSRKANRGIVGLPPEPWEPTRDDWPTGGYDEGLAANDWEYDGTVFQHSGHTKAEWLELADEMLRRWTAWRAMIATLPDEPPVPADD